MAVSLWCGMMLFCFITHSQMTGGAKVNVGYSTLKEWQYNGYGFGNGVQQIWLVENNVLTTEVGSAGGESWFVSNQIDEFNVSNIFYIDISAKPVECKSECKLSIYVIRGKTSDIPGGGSDANKKSRKKYFDNNADIAGNAPFPRNKTTNQTVQIKNTEHKQMYLAFAAKSVAYWTVYDIQMYYYYCGNTTMKQIQLSRVEAPASGFTNVTANCSANAVSSSNKTSFLARCYANGTWETDNDTQCKCLEGFGNTATGCSLCREDQYKSNTNCVMCPKNRTSNDNKTNCECKEGHHSKKLKDSLKYPCYGLPSEVQDLKVVSINETSFNITWNKPSDNGGSEPLIYEVKCYCTTCDDSKHLKCENKFRNIKYTPGSKTSTTRMIISGLEKGFKYNFTVYSKHSFEIDGNVEWKFAEEEGQFETLRQKLNKTKTSDSADYTTILALALSIAVVTLLLGLLIGTFWERRKKPKNTETAFPVELESMPEGEIGNENPIYAEVGPPRANDISSILSLFQDVQRADEAFWEFPRKRLTMLRKLGEGSFATVNKAKVTPIHAITSEKEGFVAVKMLKENASLKDQRDFTSELNLMKKLDPHPHVVQLLGCCTNSEPFFLILEYLVGGDLLGYLRKSRGYKDPYNTGEYVPTSRLGEKNLLSFAWMISDGMNFLSSEGIVHRDLAARNVLVGENNICKVSDFGLAREGSYERKSKVFEAEYFAAGRLPVKWMAPEDLLHGQSTSMSDIWSYGILLWEIFTIGNSPYPGYKGRHVCHLIESGYRMPKPSHFSNELYSLMMECWNTEPIKRPTFYDISSFFHKMLDEFTEKAHLDLTKFDDHDYENFDAMQ